MSKRLFADLETFKTVKEYRQSPEIHYSVLKELQFNPSAILGTDEHKDSDAMRLGSMVDTILTDPTSFEDQFHVLSGKKPSETVQQIITELVDRDLNLYTQEEVISVCEQFDYRRTWTRDKLFKYIVDKGELFYDELIVGRKKRLVTPDEYQLASNIAKLLATHKWTSKYFALGDKDIEILFQFKFYSKLEGVACKCMLDILLIDHFAKTIQPLDLKIGEQNFNISFFKFKWYLQGAMYKEALETFKDSSEFSEYKVENFKFIHVNTKYLNYPVIYEMDTKYHEDALLGWTETGRQFLGVYELLEDFKWYEAYRIKHEATTLIPRILVENEGVIVLTPPKSDPLPF
jgi:hypothetical protein